MDGTRDGSTGADIAAAAMGGDVRADLVTDAMGRASTREAAQMTDAASVQAMDTMQEIGHVLERAEDVDKDIARLDQGWLPWRRHKRPSVDILSDVVDLWLRLDFSGSILEAFIAGLRQANDDLRLDARTAAQVAKVLELGGEDAAGSWQRRVVLAEAEVTGTQTLASLEMVVQHARAVCDTLAMKAQSLMTRAQAQGCEIDPKTHESVLVITTSADRRKG